MRVGLNPADNGGCGFYRIREPHRVLSDQGHDVYLCEESAIREGTDVCVLQRPLHRQFVEEAIPTLHELGVAVVVEIDDDFSAIQHKNYSWTRVHPSASPDRNFHWLGKACAMADLVTCTTPALARRYGVTRAVVIPNYVPAWYLDIPRKPNAIPRVGWAGWSGTHPGDLEVLGRAVEQAQRREPFEFVAIGGNDTLDRLGIDGTYVPWVEDITEYPRVLAGLDIGLVPLADNAFNRAKSALKLMEYAACGVLPIVSPTPDNLRMMEYLDPWPGLADKPRRWQQLITRHVRHGRQYPDSIDPGILRDLMRPHTYEENAWRWLDAWSMARERFLRAG